MGSFEVCGLRIKVLLYVYMWFLSRLRQRLVEGQHLQLAGSTSMKYEVSSTKMFIGGPRGIYLRYTGYGY